ncbi:MAG: Panacea domain-containing protein [Chloroflexi bacterium]|nr:Panacea domain-containing protein [Chloroflexota bacterium]
MSSIIFEFNQTKAIEAILYLAKKIPHPGKYNICKMLYLADKVSLERYGRFIFGESYVAMPRGATPSKAYDLLKQAIDRPVGGIKVDGNKVTPLREPDLDQLSDSDIKCLDQIIQTYKNRPSDIGTDAHDDAYQKSWDKREGKGSNPIPIESIAELFPDSADLISYLTNSDA